MADTIKIINDNKSEFNIIQGSRTLDLINRLTKLDSDEKETLFVCVIKRIVFVNLM